jgi:peptidoglycan hydrolase-like protein with peptidoglycan-binding domain
VASRAGVAIAAAAAGLAVGAWLVVSSSRAGGGEAAAGDVAGTTSVVVERRSLSVRETVDGTLGYADSRAASSRSAGTVTRLPEEGVTLRRGDALFDLDGARGPILMYGAEPAWRTLEQGVSDGADVRALEANLATLGYDAGGAMRVDGHFDFATRAIVERWQRAEGLPVTGKVELGRVVFLPGARRVGKLEVAVGAAVGPGAPVVTTTAARRSVTVQLATDKQSYVAKGDRVDIVLPDGSSTSGVVSGVGKVATTDEQGSSTIEVSIALEHDASGAGLDQAPVSVSITKETKQHVLVVPVTSLLARAGGRYAVEVEGRDGRRTLVAVTPGLYADGYVEIAGGALREGMRVVVPE